MVDPLPDSLPALHSHTSLLARAVDLYLGRRRRYTESGSSAISVFCLAHLFRILSNQLFRPTNARGYRWNGLKRSPS